MNTLKEQKEEQRYRNKIVILMNERQTQNDTNILIKHIKCFETEKIDFYLKEINMVNNEG